MAATNGHQSIAFPALGTGNLKYPADEVAKAMIEAMIEYTQKNPNSCIKDVKIVIYSQDVQTQQVRQTFIYFPIGTENNEVYIYSASWDAFYCVIFIVIVYMSE